MFPQNRCSEEYSGLPKSTLNFSFIKQCQLLSTTFSEFLKN